ncbi:MAG TPA: hypothetical protein VN800_06820 [Candidatus Acidoferrales bacterium]|nr:hypothetical protein [Candidatus Acidoferrales bacterium]
MTRIARPAGVLALAIALCSACGAATATALPAPSGGSSAGFSAPPATGIPAAGSANPGAASPAPASAQPASASAEPGMASPSVELTGASGCSGSHDNRVFFDAIAGQVTWTVYCAVLPAGWFVQAGSFSLRNGGRLDITYRGPAGALLTLIEGNVCEGQASGCPASGQDLGTASFGDQPGTLLQLASGSGYAIDVNSGMFPAWTATGSGLDQAAFTGFAAALLRVAA